MNYLNSAPSDKKNAVIVGFYLPGIYPAGDYSVVSDLLAPAFLKSSADADPEIAKRYEITILNLPTTEDLEEIARQINQRNPYIVGFSVYMWNYDQMVETSRLVKELNPKVKIILGGPQVSYNPVDVLEEHSIVDLIVCGSGESRFKSLLKCDFSLESLSRISRIAYRDEQGQIVCTKGEVHEDLSKIPSPYKTGVIDLNDGRKHTVYIETVRGCPFECGYCIWGEPDKSLYKFPLEQILEDIEMVYNHPSVENVYITDACLFYTRERAKIIVDKIASCSRKIPTIATLDILVVNQEMVDSCNKLDLIRNQFHFGLQTTNPLALELLKRQSGPDVFEKRIKLLRQVIPDSEISFDLIYGLPGDNYEGFRESINFALTLFPSKLNLSPLLLLPGTPFWDDKVELGFEYENKPPYMVKSNNHYSFQDMERTIPLVLWIQVLNYFPTILDRLCMVFKDHPEFRPIDIIDRWIADVSERVDPLVGVDFDYTNESFYKIRRHIMNILSEPENCVKVYEASLEIFKYCRVENRCDDIRVAIEYYKSLIDGRENFIEDQNTIDSIKVKWIKALTPVVHGEG